MKLAIKDLHASVPALQELAAQPVPAVIAFRLAKTIKAVNSELESFETARKALCERCGTLPEGAEEYDITDQETFDNELEALRNTKVDLTLKTIKIGAMGEKTVISPMAMLLLDWLIVD